jgi:lipoprotein-anchoring transpeptidase ErfK/SrfK
MYLIIVDIQKQKLYLVKDAKVVHEYRVSTSKFGTGNRAGSSKTPLGLHRIASKIGKNAKRGEIFRARRRTRKIAPSAGQSKEDLITTRILRLQGLERGVNKGKGIDSFARHIYIHGTPQEHLIGKPASHGCIRMRDSDIKALFEQVPRGTFVLIARI